ncbi:hypothetical protein OROMI_000736 [Orobanche minor]
MERNLRIHRRRGVSCLGRFMPPRIVYGLQQCGRAIFDNEGGLKSMIGDDRIHKQPCSEGVLINLALLEPFGVTHTETAAFELPTVATKNGGPVDQALNNGLLADPRDEKAISVALLKLVANKASGENAGEMA